MNSTPCSVCKEGGHRESKCPTLVEPLKPGFHSGGGGGQYTGEDEEEQIQIPIHPVLRKLKKASKAHKKEL
jgi:hypothetical protein